MNELRAKVCWISVLFVGAILLASIQLAVSGFQSSSAFELLTNVMDEEESEDSDKSEKEEKVKEAESDATHVLHFMIESTDLIGFTKSDLAYKPVHPEITSPPPEA